MISPFPHFRSPRTPTRNVSLCLTILLAIGCTLWLPAYGQDSDSASPTTGQEASTPQEEEVPALAPGDVQGARKDDDTPGPIKTFFYFLGRFHPVVLHFPIALLVALLLLEVITLFRYPRRETDAAKWLLLVLGAVSALLAASFGVFLSWTSSYDEDLVFWHKWIGISVAVAAALALFFKIQHARYRFSRYGWAYRAALLASVVALMPAGHYGASLTHGTNFLTEYMPESLAFLEPVLGTARTRDPLTVGSAYFGKEILPILEGKCFECHGPEKQKGELRLDSLQASLQAGETGKTSIVPGDATASYFVELILLPEEDELVMPPLGKPKLKPEETVALIQWINRGAPWGDYTPPEITEKPLVVANADLVADWDPSDRDRALDAALIECHELMSIFFEPLFLDLRELLATEPKRRKALKAAYNAAFSLGEVHNLLFSRTDEDYMLTPDWMAMSMEGRIAAQAVGKAVLARDYAITKESFLTLTQTCNACHEKFSPDVDKVFADASQEEAAETE